MRNLSEPSEPPSPDLGNAPLRVLVAAEHEGVGSAETYAFDLAAGVAGRGAQTCLLVFGGAEGAAREATDGVQVVVRAVPDDTGARFKEARQLIARFRPHVVHVNQPASPVLVAALTGRVPARVVTDHVLPKRPSYNRRGQALHALTRLAATDLVVFSEQNAGMARPVWGRVPATVIRPGIKAQTCSTTREGIRRELGFDAADYVVCNVARLSIEQKRQDILIQAIGAANLEDGRIRGLLVGSGPDEPDLRALVQSMGLREVVKFAGHRPDVGCILQASDLYVHSSSWEGLGFAVVEAMAAGLPLIASDIPVMQEVLGTEVDLVPVSDVAALANAIARTKASPAEAEALGASLQARWRSEFTVDRMVGAHEALYRRRVAGVRATAGVTE